MTEPFQAAPQEDDNKEMTGWRTKKGKIIPFSEMSPSQLQKAKLRLQKKELQLYECVNTLVDLVEVIDSVAEKQGIILKDYESDYHRNIAEYRKRQKEQSTTQSESEQK